MLALSYPLSGFQEIGRFPIRGVTYCTALFHVIGPVVVRELPL